MPENDPACAEPHTLSRFHERQIAQCQHLSAHYAGHIHPHRKSDGQENNTDTAAQCQHDSEHQQQGRDRPDGIHQQHYGIVDAAAEISTQGSDK